MAELSVRDKEQFRLTQQNETGLKAVALWADTSVWQMLDFKVLGGSPRDYVDGVPNVMITESFRKKYFPNENPVGKKMYDVPIYSDKRKSI